MSVTFLNPADQAQWGLFLVAHQDFTPDSFLSMEDLTVIGTSRKQMVVVGLQNGVARLLNLPLVPNKRATFYSRMGYFSGTLYPNFAKAIEDGKKLLARLLSKDEQESLAKAKKAQEAKQAREIVKKALKNLKVGDCFVDTHSYYCDYRLDTVHHNTYYEVLGLDRADTVILREKTDDAKPFNARVSLNSYGSEPLLSCNVGYHRTAKLPLKDVL